MKRLKNSEPGGQREVTAKQGARWTGRRARNNRAEAREECEWVLVDAARWAACSRAQDRRAELIASAEAIRKHS